jgi:hypothetical protein
MHPAGHAGDLLQQSLCSLAAACLQRLLLWGSTAGSHPKVHEDGVHAQAVCHLLRLGCMVPAVRQAPMQEDHCARLAALIALPVVGHVQTPVPGTILRGTWQ